MEKKKFEGKLDKLSPKKLIRTERKDPLEIFFLTLAYIYNEFKGLTFFYINFLDAYQSPDKEISPHAGEYNGISLQNTRLIISSIYEFIIFLEKNKNILETYEFKLILKKCKPNTKIIWSDFLTTIDKKAIKQNSLVKILRRIRNNLTFHYYDSGDNLRNGYIKHFYESKKNPTNEFAYYSLTGRMRDSRFYFADAAIEKLQAQITKDIPNFSNVILSIMEQINFGLMDILNIYLRNIPERS